MLPRLKTVLVTVLAGSLIVANVTAAKIAQIPVPVFGTATVPAGFVGIAVAFLASDLLSEIYGKEAARDAVNAAIVTLGVGWALVYAAILMPAAPFYGMAEAYTAVLSSSANIVLASVLTLLVSQNIDVSVFHAIKGTVPYKFARNIGSTGVSQAIDTSMFILLGFVALPSLLGGAATPLSVAFDLIVAQYVVKVLVVLGDTPLFYAISSLAE